MIYAKTVCKKPGSYVAIVPAGLKVSLQYNQNGLLQSIEVHKDNGIVVDREHFASMSKFVPNKIALTGGTTWIEGVFYFSDIPTTSGLLMECCIDDYLERFLKEDCMCAFYAGTVTSLAASFAGAQTIRNWLGMNKFNVLPGTVVPTDLTEATLEMLMQTGAYSFKYPYILGFYVFNDGPAVFEPTMLKQHTVTDIQTTLTPDGYVQSIVQLEGEPEDAVLSFNYSDVWSHSIQVGTSILYYVGEYVEILDTRAADSKKMLSPIDNKVTCPVCNKVYYAPEHGPVQCDDPHCLSKAYPEVCRILDTFHLPELSIDDYRQLVVDRKIVTATDVLVNEPYSKMKIEGDLLQVLKAAVPLSVCNEESFFVKLLHECNNSVDTLTYYLNNPNRMVTELDLVTLPAKRFVEWCKDSYNVLTVTTLLSAIHIEEKENQFEGAPIFRGNKFVLTGKFKRGDLSKITEILEGYAAKIIPDFDNEIPTMLITGGTDENIEGRLVQAAKRFNVPIADEDTFFTHYEIDADLQASHLL